MWPLTGNGNLYCYQIQRRSFFILHANTQTEYFKWIENCIKDVSAIAPFCDWLDENRIRSQQWREVCAMLHKVKYIKQIINKGFMFCSMITAHKIIDIRLTDGKRIHIGITKRPNTLTNELLDGGMSLHKAYAYRRYD